jgi:hypothetical protein
MAKSTKSRRLSKSLVEHRLCAITWARSWRNQVCTPQKLTSREDGEIDEIESSVLGYAQFARILLSGDSGLFGCGKPATLGDLGEH